MVCGFSDMLCPCSDQSTVEGESHTSKAVGASKPSYRVSIDCGGKTFVASAATLASHSLYFANELPDGWFSREKTIFLDADPDAFAVLLAYMRQGFIKIEDIDTGVLALAKVLAMQKLLRAIKVRWYINIGKGPVVFEDEEIVAAFNEVHGGIQKAISSGLFPLFHKPDEESAEKDLAIVVMSSEDDPRGTDDSLEDLSVSVYRRLGDGTMGTPINCGLIGALNGLHANGFKVSHDTVDRSFDAQYIHSANFSRMRHAIMQDHRATDILVPSDKEVEWRKGRDATKQFVLYIKDTYDGSEKIIAPAEYGGEGNPYSEATIESEDAEGGNDDTDFWLEKHDFVTREKELEKHPLFVWYLDFLRGVSNQKDAGLTPITCGIYSNQIARGATRVGGRMAALADDEDCREEIESVANVEEDKEGHRHSVHFADTVRAGPKMQAGPKMFRARSSFN